MDLSALVDNFGLPVGLLLYFVWRDYQTSKEHKADMRDIAIKSVQAIDKSTDAIVDSTETIEGTKTVISENSNIMNTVKGVLLKGKGNPNNGNGN